MARTATLADPRDPLTLQTLTDTRTVNGRTATSPAGRVTTSQISRWPLWVALQSPVAASPVTAVGRLQAVARAGMVTLTRLATGDERQAVCPVFASATLAKGGRTQPMSLRDPTLSTMDAPGNRLDDFPPETFMVLAFCDACGHQAPHDRNQMPAGMTVQGLRGRLQCSVCGSQETQIRIVYTGAGGFRYRQEETEGSAGAWSA